MLRRARRRGAAQWRGRYGRNERDSNQDQERAEHAQDHQGDGDGRRIQDAQGAGTDARARPYAEKVRNIAAHLASANPEYKHPFMVARDVKRAGMIVVTTDKGLCGGLNTNVLRAVTNELKDLQGQA
jgi:hypothetical protein